MARWFLLTVVHQLFPVARPLVFLLFAVLIAVWPGSLPRPSSERLRRFLFPSEGVDGVRYSVWVLCTRPRGD